MLLLLILFLVIFLLQMLLASNVDGPHARTTVDATGADVTCC